MSSLPGVLIPAFVVNKGSTSGVLGQCLTGLKGLVCRKSALGNWDKKVGWRSWLKVDR